MITREELVGLKKDLVAYLLAKVKAEDWHAVQDAASDIREAVAKIELLDELTIHTKDAKVNRR